MPTTLRERPRVPGVPFAKNRKGSDGKENLSWGVGSPGAPLGIWRQARRQGAQWAIKQARINKPRRMKGGTTQRTFRRYPCAGSPSEKESVLRREILFYGAQSKKKKETAYRPAEGIAQSTSEPPPSGGNIVPQGRTSDGTLIG